MFSRAAPVVFEEIKKTPRPSSAITLDNPANAQVEVAVTFAVLVSRVACVEALNKENDYVTQKPFVPFVRFNRRVDRLGVRSGRREVCLRFGGVSAELRATSHGQSPSIRWHGSKPSDSKRHLEHRQLAAMLSDHRVRGYFHNHQE
jgi:hypothetical protein